MENEALQSVNLIGASLISAYALVNRHGKIKEFVDKTAPKISKIYRKMVH